jgi:nucleoside-diphosphate-sugar epimerase
MKKILTIFGGSGFLGKSFIDCFTRGYLDKFNICELNLVSRSAASKFKFKEGSKIKSFNYDFSTNEGLLPDETDLIISAVDHASHDFYDNGFNNDKIIENVISLTKKKYNNCQSLYISSGAVYGEQDEFVGFDESFDNPNYVNFSNKKKQYALNKHKFERAYKQISDINSKNVIARCFTFIGENVPLDQHFAIGNFYKSVINNEKILINSKLNIFRSYMDAIDWVEWLMTIFINNKLEFDIFNIGSEEKIEIENLAKIFKELFNVNFIRVNGKSKVNDIYLPNVNKAKNMYKLDYEKNIKKLVFNNFKNLKIK